MGGIVLSACPIGKCAGQRTVQPSAPVILIKSILNLQTAAPNLYPIMFGAVFLMNCFFAYDGYTEAQAINGARVPA